MIGSHPRLSMIAGRALVLLLLSFPRAALSIAGDGLVLSDSERAGGERAAEATGRIAQGIPVHRGPSLDPTAGLRPGGVLFAALLALVLLGTIVIVRRYLDPGSLQRRGVPARSLLHWLSPRSSPEDLRVLRSVRLSPRATIHVIRWDSEEWLLGCSDQSIAVLGHRVRGPQSPGSSDGPVAASSPQDSSTRGNAQ